MGYAKCKAPFTDGITPVDRFVAGAITDGWMLSNAFPVATIDPGAYPAVHALHWQPVRAASPPGDKPRLTVTSRTRRVTPEP